MDLPPVEPESADLGNSDAAGRSVDAIIFRTGAKSNSERVWMQAGNGLTGLAPLVGARSGASQREPMLDVRALTSSARSDLSAAATDSSPTTGKSARPGAEKVQTGSAASVDPGGRPQLLVRQSRWRWPAHPRGTTFLRRSHPAGSSVSWFETGFAHAPFLSAADKPHWLVGPCEPERRPS
jgi:hypothetical protein